MSEKINQGNFSGLGISNSLMKLLSPIFFRNRSLFLDATLVLPLLQNRNE